MKRKLLFGLIYMMTFQIFGQVQNIDNLSTGVYQTRTLLTDKDRQVIGYVYIFNKGLTDNSTKIKEKSIQYEYVLLDRNLNKITNGDFEIPSLKKYTYRFTGLKFHQQKLYISTLLVHNKKFSLHGQLLTVIDLNSPDNIEYKFLKGGRFSDLKDTTEKEFSNKEVSSSYLMYLAALPVEKDIVYLSTKNLGVNFIQASFYDKNYQSIFEYGPDRKVEKYNFTISALYENRITLLRSDHVTKGRGGESLITLDLKTREELAHVIYNEPSATYAIPYSEYVNNQLMVVGEIKSPEHAFQEVANTKPTLGIRRTIYNLEGEVILDKITHFNDIFAEYNFKNGTDDKGYKFILKECFNYNDGSFTLLLEKQKGLTYYGEGKTLDYIIVNFTSDGLYSSQNLIEKDKLKRQDSYLFSQENKEENEVFFFYTDFVIENRKTNVYLTVNKLKDGKLTQERLPYETESSYLRFSKSKYGYILISEYDKDEKESSIRLEKLNL